MGISSSPLPPPSPPSRSFCQAAGVRRYSFSMLVAVVVVILSIGLASVHAWVLPGTSPQDHSDGDLIRIKVNKLTSVDTQLPYPFYYLKFPRPDRIEDDRDNLGEVLMGDKVESSVYNLKMSTHEACSLAGKPQLFSQRDRKLFATMIGEHYVVNWICENLPVCSQRLEGQAGVDPDLKQPGFPLGEMDMMKSDSPKALLHNHVGITMSYHLHNDDANKKRIVGFEVTPQSIKHNRVQDGDKAKFECNSDQALIVEDVKDDEEVAFTYSVEWKESPLRWVSRWDAYLKVVDREIHWFTIINSLMIVLFLSGMMALILLRTLLRDIARYNDMDNIEEAQEESGWKLVHGDVFRRPSYHKLLAVSAGSGVQILGMAFVTLFFATLGLLSPTRRGALLQCMLFLFAVMGLPAGYVSSKFNKLFQGEDCNRSFHVTMLTAVMFPGYCFSVFFILNMFLAGKESSGYTPFGTMLLLLVLWFLISVPLVFLGSYMGYKKPPIAVPVRTNQIPRQIPPQHWLTHPVVTCLFGGVLPFGAVFIELRYVLSSLWLHHFYYMFGFLVIVLLILIVTCAEISIAFVYFQLAGEDYHWWWRSFMCSAASAFYVFLYIAVYFNSSLSITQPVSVMLYFGYMSILSYAFFLLTGAIGFISTFVFIRAIYGSIKVE
eukprot:GHVS01069026.1.p1 GENE.GHVS01069026.1~~GHVS01069026.1.p1  ORF type:complete len:661 (+),score=74.55 GHVS01069026.1:409-2391(+)